MKTLKNSFFLLFIASFFIVSCNKENVQPQNLSNSDLISANATQYFIADINRESGNEKINFQDDHCSFYKSYCPITEMFSLNINDQSNEILFNLIDLNSNVKNGVIGTHDVIFRLYTQKEGGEELQGGQITIEEAEIIDGKKYIIGTFSANKVSDAVFRLKV